MGNETRKEGKREIMGFPTIAEAFRVDYFIIIQFLLI